jgi:putative endonuclease
MTGQYCVYVVTNQRHTVLYTGVTGDLKRRIHQHREKLLPGFTHRYNVSKLVYYECTEDASVAILREKQIKAGSRRKKIELVNGYNPEWRELYDERLAVIASPRVGAERRPRTGSAKQSRRDCRGA